MTIDDRLREYAHRWNAAATPPPTTLAALADRDTLVLAERQPDRSRSRARLVLLAAVVVLMVVGAGLIAVTVRGPAPSRAPAAGLAVPATVTTAATGQPVPFGEVIPVADRVPAADVGGPLLTGGIWSLSSQTGHVVVLATWASWCGPCQQYAPWLDTLADAQVSVVGFAVREADDASVHRFVTANDITYPVVIDEHGGVADQLGPGLGHAGLPVTFLIDRQGRLAAVFVGIAHRQDLGTAVATLSTE